MGRWSRSKKGRHGRGLLIFSFLFQNFFFLGINLCCALVPLLCWAPPKRGPPQPSRGDVDVAFELISGDLLARPDSIVAAATRNSLGCMHDYFALTTSEYSLGS